MTSAERASFVRNRLPAEGLFAEKSWLIAPQSFGLSPAHVDIINRLGNVLHKFNQACNLLYRQSVAGKQPAWVAQLLDAGKPQSLIEISRSEKLKSKVPAVIRPDLILTETGFAIAELDTIPGGIGLTAWLNETYGELGEPVLGGTSGMRDGFNRIFPEGDVVIAEEAAVYRPEMEWLIGADRVKPAETYEANSKPIYRFFEGFDWGNLKTLQQTWSPEQPMTPPLKPYLEEKIWLALFWSRPLQEFWRRELGEKHQRWLQQFIPYSWVVDPTPLPPHAVIPELNIQDWREAFTFSQKQRDLILKISGFSPLAWGSRGVFLGSDISTQKWTEEFDRALKEFDHHPRLLQRFAKGSLVKQDYVTESGEVKTMEGRARICPYYFVQNDEAQLGGVLVTLCPPDKKLLHGMKDAILSPAVEKV